VKLPQILGRLLRRTVHSAQTSDELPGPAPRGTIQIDYGRADRLIAEGAVLYRDGGWRKVATHSDTTVDPITVTDTHGHRLSPLKRGDIVAVALHPR